MPPAQPHLRAPFQPVPRPLAAVRRLRCARPGTAWRTVHVRPGRARARRRAGQGRTQDQHVVRDPEARLVEARLRREAGHERARLRVDIVAHRLKILALRQAPRPG